MLKHFRKDNSGSIVSYADIRWSTGNLYKQLGFKLSHISKPNYWYFGQYTSGKLIHRYGFTKRKLYDLLEETCEYSEITEKKLAIKYGLNSIYDCGNYVFELKT